MKKNNLIKTSDSIYRVLSVSADKVLAVDCLHKAMPAYYQLDGTQISENDLLVATNMKLRPFEDLTPNERKVAIERYTIIAGVLTALDDTQKRIMLVDNSAKQFGISKQTIRNYLYDYLVYQNIAILAPKQRAEKELSADERNMRWALNKFFYTRNQNSLQSAFAMITVDCREVKKKASNGKPRTIKYYFKIKKKKWVEKKPIIDTWDMDGIKIKDMREREQSKRKSKDTDITDGFPF